MTQILNKNQIKQYNENGAVFIKGKFDTYWIKKLAEGFKIAKENSKIIYRGDWAKEERSVMEMNGYRNGDNISGKMFPLLFET